VLSHDGALWSNPPPGRNVAVTTSSWLPVYCWVIRSDGTWYLEVRTDLRRGDLLQVGKLATQLDVQRL
jgi:hypothetical protein